MPFLAEGVRLEGPWLTLGVRTDGPATAFGVFFLVRVVTGNSSGTGVLEELSVVRLLLFFCCPAVEELPATGILEVLKVGSLGGGGRQDRLTSKIQSKPFIRNCLSSKNFPRNFFLSQKGL